MDVSIILLSYNTSKTIKRCLNSIFKQTYADFEVIAVDDGSRDDTLDILNSMHDSRLRIVRNSENKGIAYSRNVGIENARGKYIFFVDSDCFVTYTWLECGLNGLKKGYDIVTGLTLYENPYPSLSDKVVQGKDDFFTCNLGFRKSKVIKAGKFNVERYNMYCEDKDLCYRILAKGGKKIYCEDMIVIHQYNPRTTKGEWNLYKNFLINKLKLHLDYPGKESGIIFRVVKPMYLVYTIFPPALLHFAFFRVKDFYILPFMWFGLIRGRLKLWQYCYQNKVFYI